MLAMVIETVKLIAMMIFDNDNSSALATVNIGGVYTVYGILLGKLHWWMPM